jgi:hypothetical protein
MGLRAFGKFHHADQPSSYDLKDAILRTHHGLETLFKTLLLQLNPVFLLPDKQTVGSFVDSYADVTTGKSRSVLEEAQTIGLSKTLERLRKIYSTALLSDREFHHIKSATEELVRYRNRLQHLELDADEEVLGRLLGGLVPRAVDTLTKAYPALISDLDDIDPGSSTVVELLRTEYDALIREAVAFFKERIFEECKLSISIDDHGRVGAPPYMPKIDLEGFILLQLDPYMSIRSPFDETLNAQYEATIEVSPRPNTLEGSDQPFEQVVENNLRLQASIRVENPEDVFRLPDTAEHFEFLRNVQINITAEASYRGRGMYNHAHYDAGELLSLEGQLNLEISAVSNGADAGEVEQEVLGTYASTLTKDNAPLRFRAFVEPNGTLSRNHILRWNIDVTEALAFN